MSSSSSRTGGVPPPPALLLIDLQRGKAEASPGLSLANLQGEFAPVCSSAAALSLPDAEVLSVLPCDPASADMLALLRASDNYMAALYPAESNHLVSPDQLRQANTLFLGAFQAGRVLGCGAVRVLDDDGRYGEIKRVFVPPSERGRGAARAIMARLESHLRGLGVGCARLETGVHQPEAIGLYRRLGYRERPAFGAYQPDPLSLFMEKALLP